MGMQLTTIKNEQLEIAKRFTEKVLICCNDISEGIKVTEKEKSLIKGYFLVIDENLKKVGISWNEIDLNSLALSLSNKAKLGLDMQLDAHLYVIPFKNKNTEKVNINMITGYKGEKHIAMKFARNVPIDIKVDLVYSTDNFTVFKRDQEHPFETYELKIINPFKRGEIIGGFGYIIYNNNQLNKIVPMGIADIIKHKPTYAKDEFWVKWYEKMCYKTIMHETCRYIEIDVDKVRNYRNILDFEKIEELKQAQINAENEVIENTQSIDTIDVDYTITE